MSVLMAVLSSSCRHMMALGLNCDDGTDTSHTTYCFWHEWDWKASPKGRIKFTTHGVKANHVYDHVA